MSVCFFGAYDRDYPRVRVFRDALAEVGVPVVEAWAAERRALFRYPALVHAYAAVERSAEALLVPAFRHKDVPLARWLGGPRPVVFDPLVSRWDTLVHDWALHAAGSAQAWWNRRIDAAALALADLVLCDTWAHGELFEKLGAPRERLRRVPVGAEREFFEIPPRAPAGPVRIRYLGGFLPLHGIVHVVEAARRLGERAASLPDYRVELIGSGIEFDRACEAAERTAPPHLVIRSPAAGERAAAVFAGADVVLGAFGTSAKAGRVVPHKVFQGAAAGRAVVTGEGPGLLELFEPGVDLLAVPRGAGESLAEALAALIADPGRRLELGARARRRAAASGGPAAIGAALAAAIEDARALGRRRRPRAAPA